MKTKSQSMKMLNMHQARILLFQIIFSYSMLKLDNINNSVVKEELLNIDWLNRNIHKEEQFFLEHFILLFLEKRNEIDQYIEKYSSTWRIDRISKQNLAILRISILQLIDTQFQIPPKVIINEAIILSQKFSDESSGKYLNAIMDKFYKENILKVLQDSSVPTLSNI